MATHLDSFEVWDLWKETWSFSLWRLDVAPKLNVVLVGRSDGLVAPEELLAVSDNFTFGGREGIAATVADNLSI